MLDGDDAPMRVYEGQQRLLPREVAEKINHDGRRCFAAAVLASTTARDVARRVLINLLRCIRQFME